MILTECRNSFICAAMPPASSTRCIFPSWEATVAIGRGVKTHLQQKLFHKRLLHCVHYVQFRDRGMEETVIDDYAFHSFSSFFFVTIPPTRIDPPPPSCYYNAAVINTSWLYLNRLAAPRSSLLAANSGGNRPTVEHSCNLNTNFLFIVHYVHVHIYSQIHIR